MTAACVRSSSPQYVPNRKVCGCPRHGKREAGGGLCCWYLSSSALCCVRRQQHQRPAPRRPTNPAIRRVRSWPPLWICRPHQHKPPHPPDRQSRCAAAADIVYLDHRPGPSLPASMWCVHCRQHEHPTGCRPSNPAIRRVWIVPSFPLCYLFFLFEWDLSGLSWLILFKEAIWD